MADLDIPVEIHSETERFTDKLERKALRQLQALKGDHTDIVGASIAVEEIAKAQAAFRYQATVVVHMRPDRVVASKKADGVRQAIQQALSALERQVRERRAKLREHWKRPDLVDGL